MLCIFAVVDVVTMSCSLNWSWKPFNKKCFLVLVLTVTLFIVLLPEYKVVRFIYSIWMPDELLPEGICKRQNDTETGGLDTNSCGATFPTINTEALGERLRNFQPLKVQGHYVNCPLLRTLELLSRVLEEAEIPYFIHSGTLLGSWRHHGFIPWDFDLDISVSWQSRSRLKQVFHSLAPGLGLLIIGHISHWKFFVNDSCTMQGEQFSNVVDVFFYHERGGYIVDDEVRYFPCLNFPRHWIFPVTHRPFHGLRLASPARTDLVIEQCFPKHKSPDICVTAPSEHTTTKDNAPATATRVNCTELHGVYPFVRRAKVKGIAGCNETLEFNGSVLSWFVGNYLC